MPRFRTIAKVPDRHRTLRLGCRAAMLALALVVGACEPDRSTIPTTSVRAPAVRPDVTAQSTFQCVPAPFTLVLHYQGEIFTHTYVLTSENGRDVVGTATVLGDNQLQEHITGTWDGTTLTLTSVYFIGGVEYPYSYTITGTVDPSGNFTGAGFSSNGQVFDPGSVLGPVNLACVAPPNVPPVVTDLTLPGSPSPLGTSVSVTATFSDANDADTHSATFDWGDGQTSVATPSLDGGSGRVSGSHVYQTVGVYTVSVTVTDNGGLSGSLSSAASVTTAYVVIYDPSGGFVTGGGWIVSPPGAYAAQPTAAGRASFGFVAKYQHGASTPSGNTQFDFTSGQFSFKSTAYQWLVVAGARAQFKGTGTINGTGAYGFLLTAVDGDLNGGGGADRFRIKIWDVATGVSVYDNQVGASDDSAPTTPLAGGSVVIHN